MISGESAQAVSVPPASAQPVEPKAGLPMDNGPLVATLLLLGLVFMLALVAKAALS